MTEIAESQEPPFVVYLSWRAVGALTGDDIDALSGVLEEADPEHCLQLPTPPDDYCVLSLVGAGSPRSATDEALSLLGASAAVIGIRLEVLRVSVFSDESSWVFEPSDPSLRPDRALPGGRSPPRWKSATTGEAHRRRSA